MSSLATLAAKLRARIIALAREAAYEGLTINEAERNITEHKNHSVSPRFAELVRKGVLVRVVIGWSEPTPRFPKGRPIYQTRWDEQTRREVYVHWLPEFAPHVKKAVRSEQGALSFEERYGS
jgi:hypothetical protein